MADHEDENADPATVQDQTLLKALQEFIVPLIRGLDGNRESDMRQVTLGPEAGKLITALQGFISNIIARSQMQAENTIEVSLVEHEQGGLNDDVQEVERGNEGEEDELSSREEPLARNPTIETHGEAMLVGQDVLENSKRTFHDKLLKALREHIFNTMPIRLLCFEPHGSNPQIALLERTVVHARLVAALREKIDVDDPEHYPRVFRKETEQAAIERLISKYARYAILSHTWLRTASGEVTYGNWKKGLFDTRDPGYQKLVHFCQTAWRDHGVTFGWMDTVCINKDSSSELDESIRSMYNWYHQADVCIVHLAETETLSDMHLDPWFTRGWTLQELLAPDVIKFYNTDWKRLVEDADNTNSDTLNTGIIGQIELATTISKDEFNDILAAPISRKMQLAANREVTREEDTAYSLMGIFGVSIATAYGEGAQRAFSRLLQEILASEPNVLDVFNWAGELPLTRPHHSRVLPTSPKYYLQRSSDERMFLGRPMEPLTLTHLGLRTPVVLMPAISIAIGLQYEPIGDYNATVDISPAGYFKDIPTTYNLLDKRISGQDGRRAHLQRWYQITFAVINVAADPTRIRIPRTCLAMALWCSQDVGKVSALGGIDVIKTNAPIVFQLSKRVRDGHDNDDLVYELSFGIKSDKLINHGMQLVSLYL